jgi:uncharacterized protein (TIGR02147 family)
MLNIFHYTDYRKFLFDWFEQKKSDNPVFSYRMLARRVGYKAPSYFPMLISGKIKMSIDMCIKFCTYMELTKKMCDYFQSMVLFGNAKSYEDQKRHFDKMQSLMDLSIQIVTTAQYRYYEKWYHSAIRALLEFVPFSDDYETIGKLLVPVVGAKDVEESIALLKELKLIEIGADGNHYPTNAVISTGYDASGMAINTFVFNSLKLSESALGRFPKNERNYSVLTLGISENGFEEIRQELREFRRKVLKIAGDDKANRVYQFSFQLFPLSKKCFSGKTI